MRKYDKIQRVLSKKTLELSSERSYTKLRKIIVAPLFSSKDTGMP